MAPYPEEIDVFSAPHSRMKQLVDVYSEKLTCTDFTDYSALESLLHDLHHTFCEFKSHEQIENKYIMRKLKNRLKSLSIHDAAVCNCHSDNRLSDMLALVEDGYLCTSKPEADRINFGVKLQNALQEFTGIFLPHMKEEEEVFQPMLMKYFEYEELKCLKEQVIKEHSKWHCYDLELEKVALENAVSDLKNDSTDDNSFNSTILPPEVLLHVFSFLSPVEIINCSKVCHLWYEVSHSPSLWKEIYPCFWIHGIWSNYDEIHEDRMEKFYPHSLSRSHWSHDEDADIDDYEESTLYSSGGIITDTEGNYNESKALQSMIKYFLPQIGSGVQKIVLSSCRGLTSNLLRSILILCPNVIYLDISYTTILDSAFKGLKEHSTCLYLEHLDLSGCKNISDLGLFRLADCMAGLPPYVPDASHHLRDVYLENCRQINFCSFPNFNCDDCYCEIEESGSCLKNIALCSQCNVDEFCSSFCFWQKNGIMCHLAKLTGQCPYVKTHEQLNNCQASLGSGSVLRTSTTFLGDSIMNGLSKTESHLEKKSLRYLNLSGCKQVTDEGLRCLLEAGILVHLETLDVSGCWYITGPGLSSLTSHLEYLLPENLYYCNQISDGPYPNTANGCQNLENEYRACCCRHLP